MYNILYKELKMLRIYKILYKTVTNELLYSLKILKKKNTQFLI